MYLYKILIFFTFFFIFSCKSELNKIKSEKSDIKQREYMIKKITKKRPFEIRYTEKQKYFLPSKEEAFENKRTILQFLKKYSISKDDFVEFKDKFFNHFIFLGIGILPHDIKQYIGTNFNDYLDNYTIPSGYHPIKTDIFFNKWNPENIYTYKSWGLNEESKYGLFRGLKPEMLDFRHKELQNQLRGQQMGKKFNGKFWYRSSIQLYSHYKNKIPYLAVLASIDLIKKKDPLYKQVPKNLNLNGYSHIVQIFKTNYNKIKIISFRSWLKINEQSPYKDDSYLNFIYDEKYDKTIVFFMLYYDEPNEEDIK